MKKKITSLFFILSMCFVYSQNCDQTATIVLNGEIDDYHLGSCITDVSINTNSGNTIIQGITLIDAMESINLKPTSNQKISIKPASSLDFIDLLITDTDTSIEDHLSGKELRSSGGNTEREEKDLRQIDIYPNPVDTILNVELDFTISYYKIVDFYGLTAKEGALPTNTTNHQLSLNTLTEGTYYLMLQATDEVLVTRIQKN